MVATFAQRLKELRKSLNLTQEELAGKLGINRSTLGSWETGNRTPELGAVVQIANYFDISFDYLMGITDNPNVLTDKENFIDMMKPLLNDEKSFSPEAIHCLKKAFYDFQGQHNIRLNFTTIDLINAYEATNNEFIKNEFHDCLFFATELYLASESEDQLYVNEDLRRHIEKLGDLIRTQRGNMTLYELAEQCNINFLYLASIERGYDIESNIVPNPSFHTLYKIAQALNIPFGDLLIKTDFFEESLLTLNSKTLFNYFKSCVPDLRFSDLPSLKKYNKYLIERERNTRITDNIDMLNNKEIINLATPTNSTPVNGFFKVPIVGRIPAGVPNIAQEQYEGYEDIPSSWLNGEPANYFILRVEGDSMEGAKIFDGDYALIKKCSACENGQICAIGIAGETPDLYATLKRVFDLDDEYIELVPESSKYPRRKVKRSEVNIFGTLKMVHRKY